MVPLWIKMYLLANHFYRTQIITYLMLNSYFNRKSCIIHTQKLSLNCFFSQKCPVFVKEYWTFSKALICKTKNSFISSIHTIFIPNNSKIKQFDEGNNEIKRNSQDKSQTALNDFTKWRAQSQCEWIVLAADWISRISLKPKLFISTWDQDISQTHTHTHKWTHTSINTFEHTTIIIVWGRNH